MKALITKFKAKIYATLEGRRRRTLQKIREEEFNSSVIPKSAIALPFNHIITIKNAHALYRSFEAIGQDCVLIDMSGGELLNEAKASGLYNNENNYLVFDYEGEQGIEPSVSKLYRYTPSLSDISAFTGICQQFYPTLSNALSRLKGVDHDTFLEKSYASYESFFEINIFNIPRRVSSQTHFLEALTRYWLVSVVECLEADETDLTLAFNQGWVLVGKYISTMIRYDVQAQRFEQFLTKHNFSRVVHFCGPYTLAGATLKFACSNSDLPCVLFHDAFMPPEQMKKINNAMPNFQANKLYVDILYKDRSDQPAYELGVNADKVTLRYPIRTWAPYDLLGLPQDYLWATWIEYPLESVGVKNTAMLEKFRAALGDDKKVSIVGNPLLESKPEPPAEIVPDMPTVIISVAPDIFSAVRFKSTVYLRNMDAYFSELSKIVSLYADKANVVIALHPRLTSSNPHYELMSKLGKVTTSPTGELLPYADLFISYVGSVMNFDAEELGIPIVALSLYDDAKDYLQNSFEFENMKIIENDDDMRRWLKSPPPIMIRNNKSMPRLGMTAHKFLEAWK